MNTKKLLSVVFACAIMICALCATAFAADAWDGSSIDTSWYNTTDTSFTIDTAADLAGLAAIVNGTADGIDADAFSGKTVVLANDIDLAEKNWTPIGTDSKPFKGYFDGANKTISNLHIASSGDYVGLFGKITGQGYANSKYTPAVKDLTLENVSISGGYRVAAVAGNAYISTIKNVNVSGNVSGTRYVGGIAGHVYATIEDCDFTGDVSCSFDAVGGIVGAGDARISDCTVIGDVTGSNWVGGIIANGQEGTSVVGCYVEGDVTSDANWWCGVGGIAGVAGHGTYGGSFSNNYFNGEVYLCGEKIDAPIIGIVNGDNETTTTKVEGNSWNTAYYPADTEVCVLTYGAIKEKFPDAAGQVDYSDCKDTAQKTVARNNNLVMLESDLEYVDAKDAANVTIMSGSSVTTQQVETAVSNNSYTVAIGDSKFATLQDALSAANSMTGDITVKIKGKVEYTDTTANLTGSYNSITFVGMSDDAEICLTRNGQGGYISASKKVVFNNLILSKPNGYHATNAGHMNCYFSIQGGVQEYNNCKFPNGACANTATATYTGCEFSNKDTNTKYSLWVYDDAVVTVDNCDFTGIRGIKMYEEGESELGNKVTVKNTDFTAATQKPAIVLIYGASVTLENNTYPTSGVFELDLEGAPNGTSVTTDDKTISCVNDNGACGVLVDGKIYTTVAQAAAVAKSGDTVTLLYDTSEEATFTEGVILNTNGHTADNVTVEASTVNWVYDIDKNGTAIRFLFAHDIDTKTIKTIGIKYVKGTEVGDITKSTIEATKDTSVSAFYGDLVGIEEGSTQSYSAIAYVITDDDKVYFSNAVTASAN